MSFNISLNFPAPVFSSPVLLLLPSLEVPPAVVDPSQVLLPAPLTPLTNQPTTTLSQAETPDVIAWQTLVHRFSEAQIWKHLWEWVTSSQT